VLVRIAVCRSFVSINSILNDGRRQTRSQVLSFLGAKYVFRGYRVLLLLCSKQIFMDATKFGGAKKTFGGCCPQYPLVAIGLDSSVTWLLAHKKCARLKPAGTVFLSQKPIIFIKSRKFGLPFARSWGRIIEES